MIDTMTGKLARVLSLLIAVMLTLLPFHALLTVWAGSNFGHYTGFRLWDEILFVVAGVLAAAITFSKPDLWKKLARQQMWWLVLVYTLLTVALGAVSYTKHDVTAKSLGFGLIVNLRFPLFFIICLVAGAADGWLKNHWRQILLVPAAIVVVIGVLQYAVLPYDFLRHFGYGPATIPPYETINHNLHYVRVMSTLRGANPLGAYLVVILSTVTVLLVKETGKLRRLGWAVFWAATFATLFFSFSRSAWIGAVLSVLLAGWLSIRSGRVRRWCLMSAAVLVVAGGLSAFLLRHNTRFQNIFTHTQQHSKVATTSDQGHVSALKAGLQDAAQHPLGHGPGTAGPASVYNAGRVRIAENYFIQIAQEIGWLGLFLFLALNALVAKGLWLQRPDPLAAVLFVSLIGISVVGLFSHVWTDDTLSYIWWGLAGLAVAPLVTEQHKKTHA